MKKKLLFMVILSLTLCTIMNYYKYDIVMAETCKTTGYKSYKTLYAVPEGGWSVINYEVCLKEKYSYNSNTKKNEYYWHEKDYCWKTACATTKINLVVSNIVHTKKDGSTYCSFTSYSKQAMLYSTDQWDGCKGYYNTTVKKYSTSTGKSSNLQFYTQCNGGMFVYGTEGTTIHKISLKL